MVKLSGYHYFMDRLRSEGKLFFYCGCGQSTKVTFFYCGCGQSTKVTEKMPLTMRCFCDRLMVVMDEKDLP
jgi:hypothetical protein